jgi:hypothetical protein
MNLFIWKRAKIQESLRRVNLALIDSGYIWGNGFWQGHCNRFRTRKNGRKMIFTTFSVIVVVYLVASMVAALTLHGACALSARADRTMAQYSNEKNPPGPRTAYFKNVTLDQNAGIQVVNAHH